MLKHSYLESMDGYEQSLYIAVSYFSSVSLIFLALTISEVSGCFDDIESKGSLLEV